MLQAKTCMQLACPALLVRRFDPAEWLFDNLKSGPTVGLMLRFRAVRAIEFYR